jgi:transcriptional regulator of arginine metabolism
VETLIRQQNLSSQKGLVDALDKFGCEVTQATVSRDMRELGVQKGTDREGKVRYVIPPPRERRDPGEVLARVLLESDAEILQAQNLLVIKTEPGTAPTIGRAIDELDHDDIVGSVAGDDTVLLIAQSNSKAGKVEAFINRLIQV